MKGFAPAALLLWGATPALAHTLEGPGTAQLAKDREGWITLGAEALEPVQASFRAAGVELAAQRTMNGVAMMRVRESQLQRISHVMHDAFNRCSGFLWHESEAEAVAALEKAGTAAPPVKAVVSYTLDNAATVNALINELQEPNIRDTITHLSSYTTRFHTSSTGTQAANWIKSHWESLAGARVGQDVRVELFTHPSTITNQPSVIMTVTGTTYPNEVVVIGGHLDSTSSGATAPGADDDASGIASITEVIRAAMVRGYQPERTVKFMGYAAEEVGLRGSKDIAAWHKNQQVNVVGVLQLDMTNYRGSSVDIGLVTDNTNAAQNKFVTDLIDTYTGATWANTTCGYACSDHASWTQNGFPASMPFEALMNQHNQAIHTVNDTLARSAGVADHALKFSKLGAAFLAELAKGKVPPSGDTTAPTVALTAPTAGVTVVGSTPVMADATDDVGVQRVEFLVDGALKGTDTTAPYSYMWDSTSATNGNRVLTARAFDSAGNMATSAGVTVTVNNPSVMASYDPVLKAPRCTTVNSVCDSGTLLLGRGNLGPEPSRPNTINNSCADGASGTYHSDESNDRIRVSTVDGTPFAPGKTVKLEATVWAFTSPSSDRLDLYYAANANSPSWVFLGTLTPPASREQTLSKTYTLPTGTLQAVRARFRYSGTAGACGTGKFDDHDDLIFAVSP